MSQFPPVSYALGVSQPTPPIVHLQSVTKVTWWKLNPTLPLLKQGSIAPLLLIAVYAPNCRPLHCSYFRHPYTRVKATLNIRCLVLEKDDNRYIAWPQVKITKPIHYVISVCKHCIFLHHCERQRDIKLHLQLLSGRICYSICF